MMYPFAIPRYYVETISSQVHLAHLSMHYCYVLNTLTDELVLSEEHRDGASVILPTATYRRAQMIQSVQPVCV